MNKVIATSTRMTNSNDECGSLPQDKCLEIRGARTDGLEARTDDLEAPGTPSGST